MSVWDKFVREGERNEGGGDFPERPHVPDGMYRAEVVRVGEPYDKPNPQSGEMETKFPVEFKLTGRRLPPEGAVLPDFPRITDKFMDTGMLHPKAKLYQIMDALGFDMERFMFRPEEWVGLRCQIAVKNEDGVSWINGYYRAEDEDETPAPRAPAQRPAARQPVAAGAGARRRASDDDDDY